MKHIVNTVYQFQKVHPVTTTHHQWAPWCSFHSQSFSSCAPVPE